ncbi:unnamed protein product, partial [Pylaiella littoralis]
CGGRLHGLCGEVEDPDGNDNHRICHTCFSKRSNLSNAAKRKQEQGSLLQQGASKKINPGASKPRRRLDLGEKLEVLKLLDQKVSRVEISRRFGCGPTAIGSIRRERKTLEAAAASSARSTSSKSARGGDFPQVDKMAMTMVEEARKVPLPLTRTSIESFGVAARKKPLTDETTTAADKKKLESFNVSEKWVRNFISRNRMKSVVLHGEAGSVDDGAIAEGLTEIRKACQEYELENIFNVDETGIFYKLLPKRTYLSKAEKRQSARGTKGMKAKDRVSAYMCTNATGSGKVPMSIIGKSKNPRCFRKAPPPIKYFSQANA